MVSTKIEVSFNAFLCFRVLETSLKQVELHISTMAKITAKWSSLLIWLI